MGVMDETIEYGIGVGTREKVNEAVRQYQERR